MSASPSSDPTRLALVGAGTVGTVVASLLQRAGHRVVGVTSRSPDSAARAAERLTTSVLGGPEDLSTADLILIGAGDGAIAAVAASLAPHVVPGTKVVHFAGTFGIEPLQPLEDAGARPAALHPVQALPTFERGIEGLPGSAWGVTCAAELRAWAHALIRDELVGEPYDVAEDDRPLWHAASVTTSNGIAALMSAGERILGGLGMRAPERVLGPLAAGTVANAIVGGGGSETLTGPVVRGERVALDRHLRALRVRAPELVESYRLAARLVLEGAEAGGRISPEVARSMRAVLEGSS